MHERLDRRVAELALGLALELRVAQAHRDDGGEALADVLADEVLVLLLQQVLGPGVPVDHRGERGLEALLVRAALDGVDAVGEGVDAVGVVAGVPLERELDLLAVLGLLEVADLGEQRLLRLVDVLDEVDDAAGVLVGDRLVLVLGPLVREADLEALVEERHHLEALEDRARRELDGLEDGRVGPERDGGAGAATRRVADDLRASPSGTPPSANSMRWRLPSRSTSTTSRFEQRVDDRHADAVQAAGDLVAVAAELAAAVELGEGDLDAGQLVLAVDVDRDAAAVVDHPAAAVGQERDVDAVAVAGHGLVDRVVDDLPDEVVQAGRTGAADVHAGPLPDRFEAFEDLHVPGPVRATSLRQRRALSRGGSARCSHAA